MAVDAIATQSVLIAQLTKRVSWNSLLQWLSVGSRTRNGDSRGL
jgi:hypothetical protein